MQSHALTTLAGLLLANHGKVNDCLQTNYKAISGLKLQASTTNGTSGIGRYRGMRVYWYLDSGYRWSKEHGMVKTQSAKFICEVTK
jgi:hypothetical protein